MVDVNGSAKRPVEVLPSMLLLRVAAQRVRLSTRTLLRHRQHLQMLWNAELGRWYLSEENLYQAPLISLGRAGKFLNRHYSTLWRWCREGKLEYYEQHSGGARRVESSRVSRSMRR